MLQGWWILYLALSSLFVVYSSSLHRCGNGISSFLLLLTRKLIPPGRTNSHHSIESNNLISNALYPKVSKLRGETLIYVFGACIELHYLLYSTMVSDSTGQYIEVNYIFYFRKEQLVLKLILNIIDKQQNKLNTHFL